MKQVTIYQLTEVINSMKFRSAWDCGVKVYALDLLKQYDEMPSMEIYSNVSELERALLNGADSWRQYSDGGMALIYDCDICSRLCSPSVQKIRHNGAYRPNRQESWLDVQERALYQAWKLIAATFWALQNGDINAD